MVGALLCEPDAPKAAAGAIFFDNAGYLGMCGHGTIGIVATLAHLGRIGPGAHHIDTPVGVVSAELFPDGRVTIGNVPSFRHRAAVEVDVPGHGRVTGDVAWGGNWFFLIEHHDGALLFEDVETLTEFTWRVRAALWAAGITGADSAEIDHIELVGASTTPDVDSRNFVLCPAKVYDRSPCGTGTSAKLACLYADGRLAPDQIWRQESITGSVFEARFTPLAEEPGKILPFITGMAHVTAEATLILDARDPLWHGI
jgi:4-hydroxyproline epimerase